MKKIMCLILVTALVCSCASAYAASDPGDGTLYSISVSPNNSSYGSAVASPDEAEEGTTVYLNATPYAGYEFDYWEVSPATPGDINNPHTSFTMPDAAVEVTAYFKPSSAQPPKYIVTFTVQGGNGKLTAKIVNGADIANGESVEEGKYIIFTADPDPGYIVKSWSQDGSNIGGNKSTTFTLQNLSDVAMVIVEFESDTAVSTAQVNFDITGGKNGTLKAKVDGAEILSGAQVTIGKDVDFTAAPNSGYRVKQWKLNDVLVPNNTTNNYKLSGLSAASKVTVEFEPTSDTYVVNFSVTGGNGSLTAKVDGTAITTGKSVARGSSVVFTASPNSGYRVKSWTLNNITVAGNTSDTYTLSNLNATSTVRVQYELKPGSGYIVSFGVTGSHGSLTAKVDNSSIKSGDLIASGKSVVFTATPSSGYRVKAWTKGGVTVSGNTSNEYVLSVSATASVRVEFELDTAAKTYTITFSVLNGHGSLKAMVDGTVFYTGNAVLNTKNIVFTATPDSGYRVKAWTKNGSTVSGNTSNSYTLYGVTASTTIKVEFEPSTTTSYSVTFNAASGTGTLMARVDGVIINSGASVVKGKSIVFTASPATGSRVKSWTRNGVIVSGNTSSSYTLTNLTAPEIIRVTFESSTGQGNAQGNNNNAQGNNNNAQGNSAGNQGNYNAQSGNAYNNQYNNNLHEASDWAQAEIQEALFMGFVPDDLHSRYTEGITREEFCRMAVMYVETITGRFIDDILAERGVYRDPYAFTDTDDPIIQAAFALGITNGTGDGVFTPYGIFDREQAARMIMNVCLVLGQYVYYTPPSGFDDMDEASDWATEAIDYCYANNIMIGIGNNLFGPSEVYTREQSILTFHRIPM